MELDDWFFQHADPSNFCSYHVLWRVTEFLSRNGNSCYRWSSSMNSPGWRSLHLFRHSHGSHMLANGVPLPVVSQRLGHSSVRVTADVYMRILSTVKTMRQCKSGSSSGA